MIASTRSHDDPVPGPAPGPAPRILIVDDERSNRELLRIMLSTEGFALQIATNGEEALAIVAQEQPDLILLDVMMPEMDGYQVVTRLKGNPETVNIPIILITALDDRKAKMRGLEAGAEEFLSKPVDRAELQVRIRNLLRLKAYSDYHREYTQILQGEVSWRTAELVKSEERYRQIVESTTDGIVKLDIAGVIVFANRRFAAMLGYEVPELLGKSVFLLIDGPEETIARDALERRSQGITETFDLPIRCKDGKTIAVSLASTPIFRESGSYVGALATARDVTEQRKLLAQVTLSDRMASIGILAAGVAHEINNPLACIMANLEFTAEDILERSRRLDIVAEFNDVTEALRDAREATKHIRDIVRDLKIFSRSDGDATGPVDSQRIMESSLRMAWNEVRHRARLVKVYGKTPLVEASEARLGQVFLNIIVNAAQAIVEGHENDNEIRITTTTAANGGVFIEVADTGPGMPPEVVSRLFTPFFTTKPIGVGTGLGLSICHRIITGFGGTINVTSALGKGTSFRIWLPQAHTVVSHRRVSDIPSNLVPRRRGKILVVDDEPMIAQAVQRILATEHEVVGSTRADDALKRIGNGERFDVILCDLMMPQMTGMDLHGELSRVAQEQADRMIFVTGGAFTTGAQTFLDQTSNPYIEKPFNGRDLRALINSRIQ